MNYFNLFFVLLCSAVAVMDINLKKYWWAGANLAVAALNALVLYVK